MLKIVENAGNLTIFNGIGYNTIHDINLRNKNILPRLIQENNLIKEFYFL